MSHKSFYSIAVSLGGFDDQNFSSLAYYFSVAKKKNEIMYCKNFSKCNWYFEPKYSVAVVLNQWLHPCKL